MIAPLLYPARKRALVSLFSDLDIVFPDISFSEQVPLQVALVDAISSQSSTRLWEPLSLTGWTFRAGIGNSFLPPIAGAFTLTFTALDTSTETTAPIAYNATALDIQNALNAGAKMTAAGGCVVTGSNGYFFITFNVNANRGQITGDATNLAPTSMIEVGTLVDGSASLKEVQTIRLLQIPAAYAALTVVGASPAATVTVVQAGDGTHNCKVRVKLDPLPFDGKWTFSVNGVETNFLAYNISQADLLTALEALSSVGTGNVSVSQEASGQYLIMFVGALALMAVTVASDPTGLRVIDTRAGILDTSTAAMEILLGTSSTVDCFFEIEGTDPDGKRQKLLKWPVKIIGPIINGTPLGSPVIHFYTADEVDALLALKADKDVDGNVYVGSSFRLCPIVNGAKVQTSGDGGATWTDGPSWTN